jgi:anti-anti-sigma factor
MNLTTDRVNDVSIVRVGEPRLMYPLLPVFAETVSALLQRGDRRIIVELSAVTYIDSATLGCLMDLYRQATAAGGRLKLAGVQKRVETMLTMTGALNFIDVYPDEASALSSFGG